MKKFIALFTLLSFLSFGIFAQEAVVPAEGQEETVVADSAAVAEEVVAEEAVAEEGPIGGIYKSLKIKFIEGSAGFMSCVALALVLGLAFCIERILYLNMSSVDVKALLAKVEKALLEE